MAATITEVERQLAELRHETAQGPGPAQRTSVMTHLAWVPPDWADAAERTLAGGAAARAGPGAGPRAAGERHDASRVGPAGLGGRGGADAGRARGAPSVADD